MIFMFDIFILIIPICVLIYNFLSKIYKFIKTKYIVINGFNVPVNWSCQVSSNIKNAVYNSKKFKDFIKSIDYQIIVSEIDIQSVDMFGPNVGFIKLKAEATRQGKKIPSIAFIRGDSVGVCAGRNRNACGCRAHRPAAWTQRREYRANRIRGRARVEQDGSGW